MQLISRATRVNLNFIFRKNYTRHFWAPFENNIRTDGTGGFFWLII